MTNQLQAVDRSPLPAANSASWTYPAKICPSLARANNVTIIDAIKKNCSLYGCQMNQFMVYF
ncbi:hypothetical protein [Bradyrhizobium sp. 45]|uniref:hypothetical protein n=1 Tax=Bradyrhizobium sp. 45 TaxID=1043587 RepID=UPI001FF9DEC5|nr:hypothetical protein [Bradyrhizobium sp. 45]